MAKWEPHPSVRPLLAAIKRAEERRRTMTRNQRLGRDEQGRAPMFPSLLADARAHVSPLGGQAKPAAEQQSKSKR
jgi:hypothetical protein